MGEIVYTQQVWRDGMNGLREGNLLLSQAYLGISKIMVIFKSLLFLVGAFFPM